VAGVNGPREALVTVRPVPGTALPGDAAATVDPAQGGADAAAPIIVGAVTPTERGVVVEVVAGGWRFELEVEPARRAALRERATRSARAAGSGAATELHAMIPGRVVAVSVAAGDAVSTGAQLLVVEAMKMQNEVRSPADALVARVVVSAGDTVELGDLLVVLGHAGTAGIPAAPADETP
jgi:oxaloacetate decarboxylase (Na+ extruding) subunit alpha